MPLGMGVVICFGGFWPRNDVITLLWLLLIRGWCADGTASQNLLVYRSPVSETASRQHLRSAARNVYVIPLLFLLFLPVFWKHSSSQSTSVSSALQALEMMRYINLRFTLHYITSTHLHYTMWWRMTSKQTSRCFSRCDAATQHLLAAARMLPPVGGWLDNVLRFIHSGQTYAVMSSMSLALTPTQEPWNQREHVSQPMYNLTKNAHILLQMITICIYTVIHKKRGGTFVIITLVNLDGF